jgi:hypothetical protein
MKVDTSLGVIALGFVTLAALGCDNSKQEHCEHARRAAATAWQAYESAARESVNRLDDEATTAARSATDAANRAEANVSQIAPRMQLSDILPPPPTADAGGPPPAAPPTTAGARPAVPVAAAPAVDPRRAQLEAARAAALAILEMVTDAAHGAHEASSAVTSRDQDAAHTAAGRARDAAARASSTAARVSAATALQTMQADGGGPDSIAQGMARITEGVNALVQSARDAADAAEHAADALDAAVAGLARANAALNASGAALRNAVQARTAAHAVPDEPGQPLLTRARQESEAAWQSCNGH